MRRRRVWGILSVAPSVVGSWGLVHADVELPREIQTLPASYAQAEAVALSPDGEHVYVAALNGMVVVYDRDPADGTVSVVQTLVDGVGGVDGVDGARAIAVTPDGAHAYVVSSAEDAIAALAPRAHWRADLRGGRA